MPAEPAERYGFAARQGPPQRSDASVRVITLEENGNIYYISKTKACAIISGHPRCSKDRLTRVRGKNCAA